MSRNFKSFKMGFAFAFAVTGLLIGFQNCSGVNFVEAPPPSHSLSANATPESLPHPIACVANEADKVQLKIKWDWYPLLDQTKPENFPEFSQVMMTPLVADLNNDTIPEVVFTTFTTDYSKLVKGSSQSIYNQNGVLRIVDGRTGQTIKSVGELSLAPFGTGQPLLVDLDGDLKKEILYAHHTLTKIIALNFDGSFRWEMDTHRSVGRNNLASYKDASGKVHMSVDGILFSENDSNHQPQIQRDLGGGAFTQFFFPLSPEQTDKPKLFTSKGVFDPETGNSIFQYPFSAYVAAAELNPNYAGYEVVGMSNGNFFITSPSEGKVIVNKDLSGINELLCGSGRVGGGTPTVGNFDDNPETAEIAVATGRYLSIFDSNAELIAKYETQDCSSLVTGISSFDFNGDGKTEILYADEKYLRVFELRGNELVVVKSEVNPSGTLFEFPVVVDVDGNNDSDLILASNNYAVGGLYRDAEDQNAKEIAKNITGVRAFSSATDHGWMPTNPSWPQFSYNPLMALRDQDQKGSKSYFEGYLARTFGRNSQLSIFEPSCVNE